jgi:hypothetical protein
MLVVAQLLLGTQSSSEEARITFDFDCARATPPAPCKSLLPTVAAEGRTGRTWNDRAVPVDLDGDRKPEYVAPIRCGATGNCDWIVLAEKNCRVLGRLRGAFITVARAQGEAWSRVEGYSTVGAGHGILVRYVWVSASYHEASTNELSDPGATDYLAAIGKIKCPANWTTWFQSGETQAAWGVLWVYSIPSFVVLSALSWLVYVRYRRATNAAATTVIYLGNLLVVLAGGFALTYAAFLLW